MKSIMLLVILLLLSGTSLGDQPRNSYNPPRSYQSPPSGYGTPPKPPQEKCYAEKCTDAIIITKTGFNIRVVTETIPSIVPVHTQSLTTTIYSTDITQVKTVCNPVPTVIYNVKFFTSSSTYYIDECIPTKRTRMITNYIPSSIPVTINQCVQSQVYHTVPSINIQTGEVPVNTFHLTASTKQWTTYEPTSTMEYHPICTESMKCERGYGYTQSPYH
ncbi:unnamed protein product [Meganyctiphanes norvegica]|uniref:Uncharacterized protein n=1 Tax=Meganyctiphanes norvegica TaxID=48144 RepID=A0AAV2SD07_MEGNR